MTTFTNIDKSSAPTFSNESRNTATFTNTNKSDQTLFGDLTISQIEDNTFDGIFQGRPLSDWAFDDVVGGLWSLQSKS